jgi:cytochrome c556
MRALALLILVMCSGQVLADEVGPPAEVIRSRQAVMKALGAHLKALAPLATKKVNLPGHAQAHARAIVDLTKLMRDLFPKGTGPATGLSDAKEAIWTDEKKFAEALGAMTVSADKLVKVADEPTGDLKLAVDVVNDACVGCHKPFRANR